MWALIAFILLGVSIATLIEINERVKAKKKTEPGEAAEDNCPQEKAEQSDCPDCALLEVCEKKTKQ